MSSVQILVLDEVDRMLDLGFIPTLRQIVKLLPWQRQTLLFSTTMPKAIARLAEEYLDNPANMAVASVATTAERVNQCVISVPSAGKPVLLTTLLRDPAFDRVLVFTRTKHGADRLVRHLDKACLDAAAIHGSNRNPSASVPLLASMPATPGFLSRPISRRAGSMWKAYRTTGLPAFLMRDGAAMRQAPAWKGGALPVSENAVIFRQALSIRS